MKGAPKRWSYEDYCTLDDDRRYELHEGELVPMYPGPDFDHQNSCGELYIRMKTHADAHRLGTVIIAPFDVVFDAHNTAQPDVLFVAKARTKLIQPRGVFGAPDLVVEVVSPSSVSHDRSLKRKLYARFGVKEFWLVDHRNRTIEILELRNGDYEPFSFAAEKGKVRSKQLKGFELDVAVLC
jgi:Uma2 family endonuclease